MGTHRFAEVGSTLVMHDGGTQYECEIIKNEFGSFRLFPFEPLGDGWTRFRVQIRGEFDDAVIAVDFPDKLRPSFEGPARAKLTHFAVHFPTKGPARVLAVKTRQGRQWYSTVSV